MVIFDKKRKIPARKIHRFYPDCGCKSPQDCVPCPHCGMCIANIENCTCQTLRADRDETKFVYDPHVEIAGG